MNYIVNSLDTPELLAQLAEEASELSKAALKLRRALDGKNPTPVTVLDALYDLHEEMADALLCMVIVGLDEISAEQFIRTKIQRWYDRIQSEKNEKEAI